MHILVLPALAGALLLLSFRPRPRWPRRVRLDPLLLFTCATLVLLGTIAQINPVWLIGPFQPGSISSGAVPDWYMWFLDGPLRLMPAWELSVAGHPVALGVLIAGLVVPGLFFTGLALYPAADRWITGGRPPRGPPPPLLPPKPADLANRTATGVAGLTFYGLLVAAAANDQIAYHLHLDLYTVTWIFRVLVLAGPVLAFLLTRMICHALADRRRDEELHGRETGRIVMNPQGGYTEIREPARRAAPPRAIPHEPATTPERGVRPTAMDRSRKRTGLPAGYLYVRLRPHPPPRLPGRDSPLGPGGADRQEDGQADLLRQRQLGPARGRRQPRLHQPRAVRDRYPVPRSRREPVRSRVPGRRDPDSRPPGPGPAGFSSPPARPPKTPCYHGERERAERGAPEAPPIRELRRAMADAHPDRGGSAEQFIEARRRYETALRADAA